MAKVPVCNKATGFFNAYADLHHCLSKTQTEVEDDEISSQEAFQMFRVQFRDLIGWAAIQILEAPETRPVVQAELSALEYFYRYAWSHWPR